MARNMMAAGVFTAYRLISAAATPVVRRHLLRRVARGREDPARLGERYGQPGAARPPGPLVWIHGASVGESLSALPLIERIHADWPRLNLLMTTGTVTSARLMAERLPEGAIHHYAPLDLPSAGRVILDDQDLGAGLIHSVLHLGAAQTKVDRHRHAAVGTGTEQGDEQARRIL